MTISRRIQASLRILGLSTSLGMAAGLLEVLAILGCATVGLHGHYPQLNRHYVWLIPVTNLAIFLAFGLILAPLTWLWPRLGNWLATHWLGALAVVPALLVVFPEVSTAGWLALAWGVAVWLAPLAQAKADQVRRTMIVGTPVMAALVLASAAWIFGSDWIAQSRENDRPLPPSGAPKVLLVVLDTLRADHVSAFGYDRKTTPTLEFLASRGVRFDAARSAAPWTLPSHASLMTGKLPHQLGIRYMTPLDLSDSPTLAEYLGSRGYATAGFVANVLYCGRQSGMDTGFTHYEDYSLHGMDPFLMARLSQNGLMGLLQLFGWVHSDALVPLEKFVQKYVVQADYYDPVRRKDAAMINRQFLGWLDNRHDRHRPFFTFLNYYDAHTPYYPPHRGGPSFGLRPTTPADQTVLMEWVVLDKPKLPLRFHVLAQDAYDDSIRYLDDQLGLLFAALADRGELDNTLVLVMGDHGEGFGEHGLWIHAESLYLPEIHVPLIVMPPRSRAFRGIVTDPVSLVDIPATVVDLAGLAAGSPFPGHSLALTASGSPPDHPVVSELHAPDPTNPNQGRSPATLGPLTSLELGPYRFIHRGDHVKNELYNILNDPDELHDLSADPALRPVIRRFQRELARVHKTP
jgi:arylsulfatase A-like enzyme